jgi:hypothetical protein
MRNRFSIEWYNKGKVLLSRFDKDGDSGLLFESYIYLWIALTVAAKEYCASDGKKFENDNHEKATDKEEILHWANVKKNKIIQILKDYNQDIQELCEREGSKTKSPIMDVDGESIIKYHEKFISYWEGNNRFIRENDIVKTFILILNRVRNNLFHGGKSFSVESDCEILKLTCPVLKRITLECINSTT